LSLCASIVTWCVIVKPLLVERKLKVVDLHWWLSLCHMVHIKKAVYCWWCYLLSKLTKNGSWLSSTQFILHAWSCLLFIAKDQWPPISPDLDPSATIYRKRHQKPIASSIPCPVLSVYFSFIWFIIIINLRWNHNIIESGDYCSCDELIIGRWKYFCDWLEGWQSKCNNTYDWTSFKCL